MIRHVVMFKFKEEAEGRTKKENLEIATSMISNLKSEIEYILRDKFKLNSDKADCGNYDLIYISDFNNLEELKKYSVHPTHLKLVEFLKNVREERACIDLEMKDE